MENNSQPIGKGIVYSPYLTKDKHYYGGFFNLANENILVTFNELRQRLRIKNNLASDKLLDEIFKEEMSWVDYLKMVTTFSEYFPIARFLDKEFKKDGEEKKAVPKEERISFFKETFKKLLAAIESLRHYYTHYYHDSINIPDDVFVFLDDVLLKIAFETKKDFLKKDETREAVSYSLQNELNKLYILKIASLEKKKAEIDAIIKKQKANGEKPRRPFRFNKGKDEIISSIYNDAIKSFIFEGDNGKPELSQFKQTKANKRNKPDADAELPVPISTSGIVFLLSLFLNKKEVANLKSNIKGFKGNVVTESCDLNENSIKFMTTHRIYSMLAFKGLKRKIRTSEQGDKETLLMQMLDEMSKVPDCIYQNLNSKHQLKFVEDWNEYFKDNAHSLIDAKVIHPVIRKRYEDKFNYFVLRFLDEYASFPTLRFQVYLGNYIHHVMPKQIGSSEISTERVIKEKITVYGRLSDLNKAKSDFFLRLSQDEDTSWEIFPNPSYLFPKEPESKEKRQLSSGKIGICVKLKNQAIQKQIINARTELNKLTRKNNKPSKEEIIEHIIQLNGFADVNKPTIFFGEATAYLSMNDIHSLLYELLVNNKSGKELEDAIIGQIQKQAQQVIDKDTNSGIFKKSIKQNHHNSINIAKLKRDLEKEVSFLQSLINEQEKREKDYEATLKDKKYPPEKKRKSILKNREKGSVAVWLANDIKRFMPGEFKTNWKGYMHSEFQKALAYFETSKLILKSILTGLSFNDYPFSLHTCFKKNTLHEFYATYLKKRLGYTQAMLIKLMAEKDNKEKIEDVLAECFKCFKKQNYTSNDLDTQVKQILAWPFFINRGFLDSKPTVIHGKQFAENKDLFAGWFVHYKDYKDYQKFYDCKLYPVDYSGTGKRKILQNIKQQQKNDVYTLLMSKTIFKNLFNTELEITLKDLFQTKEERDENAKDAMETGERNINYIWNKTVDVKLFDGKIKIKDVKLKDVGNFRKYEFDKRVRTLLDYEPGIQWQAYLPGKVETNEIPVHIIERQIDAYENIRSEDLLKRVQRLEQFIYQEVGDKSKLMYNGNHNFKYYVLNGWLKEIKKINIENFKIFSIDIQNEVENTLIDNLENSDEADEQNAFILVYIRNKFAHNQLPKKEFFDFCLKRIFIEPNQSYAEYFAAVFDSTIEKLKNSK
jgi:hypothetical protein